MATQTGEFPPTPINFPSGFLSPLRAAHFLILMSAFLIVLSAANAQSPQQQYVYGSVPAASTSSGLAGFAKSGQTGALSLIPGSPFNERLEGGLVAIDGQGKFLFVLNPKSNDISMFRIDQASGALSEVQPGSPFAVPPTINPNMAPSQPLSIATESSGRFLFVGYFSGGGASNMPVSIRTSYSARNRTPDGWDGWDFGGKAPIEGTVALNADGEDDAPHAQPLASSLPLSLGADGTARHCRSMAAKPGRRRAFPR